MNAKVIIFLGLAAIVAADSRETYAYRPPHDSSEESFESYESGEAKYDFSYAVQHEDSGNDFGHEEARDGEHTQGSYYVRLPDTRLQTVKYFVDGDSGYVAEVNYDGEARFPDSYESASFESASFESREYRPPRPSYFYGSNESK
ncbi:cuticle protein 7-like [Penaeus vannamei]|uniref:cuticle protein 7-like n=1 Tax=Penaeus vannamei TaxID=6689 RepID=UPI000F690F20|nr:cuticle protein 8-like [Penaeus vannamei]XP_027211778.1 cuticle protein 8-like [Penaeus vannamei]XP_027218574.1 cuticle protein 8-like [Penaeus vannamei]